MELAGCRATVMGLGHFGGGVAVARWLAAQGAEVTVTDQAAAHQLVSSLEQLAEVPIARYRWGGHREADFLDIDLLVVNPAVRPGNRFVEMARQAGARITTELELFLQHNPAGTIGITGSNGKSTTAAMLAAILRADGRNAWLGGNLGGSLLEHLDAMEPRDWVVLEMSSFQLARLGSTAPPPRVAIVTSFAPNHLDWHGDLAHYRAAKRSLFLRQSESNLTVLNTLDAEVATWLPMVQGKQVALPPLGDLPSLRVPGWHNRANAACAAAAADALGCSAGAIRQALGRFCGLPERLELLATLGGVRVYNDSAATTPESTLAALTAIREPIWLLAGGHDKGLSHASLAAEIAERCRGAAFFGSARERLREHVTACGSATSCTTVESLPEAFAWCWERARPGEAILLSPACSSHDQFLNYRHRSSVFRTLVETQPKRYNR